MRLSLSFCFFTALELALHNVNHGCWRSERGTSFTGVLFVDEELAAFGIFFTRGFCGIFFTLGFFGMGFCRGTLAGPGVSISPGFNTTWDSVSVGTRRIAPSVSVDVAVANRVLSSKSSSPTEIEAA